MKLKTLVTLLLSLLVLTSSPAKEVEKPKPEPVKKRIAVLPFGGDVWYIRGESGITDMVTTALAKSKKFILVERRALDQVLKEQNLGKDGRLDPKTVPKLGKILGVEALLIGTVTWSESSTSYGGIAVGPIILSGWSEAKVRLDARMVDTETAELLWANSAEATKRGPRGIALLTEDVKAGYFKMRFEQSLVGKATKEAVGSLSKKLVKGEISRTELGAKEILVAKVKVEEKNVILNAGELDGIKVGDRFVVAKPTGEVIVDPKTGEPLGQETKNIATLEVTKVYEKMSEARILEAIAPIEIGDKVFQI